MGRTGHPALILGTAAILVATVGTSVALTRGDGPVANAATTLTEVHDTQVIAPSGAVTAARDGQRVAKGDVVRTGPRGSVELVTRGRVVYVERSAIVAVIDGAHQQIRKGGVVIDAQHGPGMQADLAGDTLSVPAGSAIEANRSVYSQIGALAGSAQVTSSSSRQLTIPRLAQAVINGDALPAATTPLHLTDNSAEAHAVPTLVSDDVALKTLAQGIDSSGGATAQVIESAWTGAVSSMPTSTTRSDRVLPMVIADSTAAAGGTTQDRYDHTIAWRRNGGSWGVIVELLSGHAPGVEAALASLQRNVPTGHIGTVSIQALATPPLPGGHPATKPTSRPTSPASPPANPGDGGHHGGTPPPSPSPTPTRGVVGKVVKTVGGVVSTVLGLLPLKKLLHPSKPHPKPTGGLLGGLLGK
jgi:hypothetical protein